MRNDSVTIAKGLGILLMVIGHVGAWSFANTWVSMFHMAVFFFFAGYCMKEKYLVDFKSFSMRRIQGIYLPFIKWNLIFMLLHNVFAHMGFYEPTDLYAGMDYVLKTKRFCTQMADCEQLLGGFWFLKSLFFASFFGYAAIRFVPRYWREALLLVVTFVFAYFKLAIPYVSVGKTELMAALVFVIGYDYKQSNLRFELKYPVIILLAVLAVTLGAFFWPSAIFSFTWQFTALYLISAVLGVMGVFAISCLLDAKTSGWFRKLALYIGDNTLAILIWHFLIFKLVTVLFVMLHVMPSSALVEFPVPHEFPALCSIAYIVIGAAVPLLISKIGFLKK